MRRSGRKQILQIKAWAPTHDWRPDRYSVVSCRVCAIRLTVHQKETREAPTCEEELQRKTVELVMTS